MRLYFSESLLGSKSIKYFLINHKLFSRNVKIAVRFVCFSFSDEAYIGCYKDMQVPVMTHEFTAPSENNSLFFFEYNNVMVAFCLCLHFQTKICNGNRTEWSPIRSVIIRVITKSDNRAAGV